MTLELSILELAIAQRLDPLRQALDDYGIPVRCLPKEAGKYSEEEVGQIAIFVPNVQGVTSDLLALTAQDTEINVNINLSLGKRYQDVPGEKDVLEYVADQVIGLLLGFYPYAQTIMRRPLYVKSYELFKPSGGRWESQLQFGCVKQIRSIPLPDNYEVTKVSWFASLDLLTGTKMGSVGQ
jgi:hypothetical protein